MKFKLMAIGLGAALLLALPSAADACSRSVSKKAASTIVPAGKINQSLLDQAVRAEVNYHRCRAGLPKVGSAGNGLTNQALKHSVWMARTQQLTHKSTVAGHATLKQRIKKANVSMPASRMKVGIAIRSTIGGSKS